MFEKIKIKLKNKLIKFLGIDTLENKFNSDLKKVNIDLQHKLYIREQELFNLQKEMNTIHMTLKSILSVGADIRHPEIHGEHSWAVICIEGNINIVKFVNLERQSARQIMDYLKQFEGGRMVVDTPMYPMFYDNFTFNKDFKKSRVE